MSLRPPSNHLFIFVKDIDLFCFYFCRLLVLCPLKLVSHLRIREIFWHNYVYHRECFNSLLISRCLVSDEFVNIPGKRPRDLLNPKAVKYLQAVFAIKDAISKRESREISALFGITVAQVSFFFLIYILFGYAFYILCQI